MAKAAVAFLLTNVQKLLVERVDLISGAEKELKLLQSDLELMNAFLIDYGNQQEKGQVFIQLERQIREAVYAAEDTCDACLTHKAKASGRILGSKNLDLAKRVKELRLELKPIFDHAMMGLTALPVTNGSSSNRPRRSDDKLKKAQMMREDNVVGFKDQEETLINYLLQETEELDVISIVGMPGLGKTTLARKIYQDPRIQSEFPTLIWVDGSQELNVREVFLTILKNFTQEDMSGMNNKKLVYLVRSHLGKGKFLLFIDDVWTVEDWKKIEDALPKKNNLVKVLITSRHERVATQTNPNRKPHKLRFLTFEESWELLQLEAFGKNNACPEELEEIGMQISRQCRGVPLAVVVIGGILVEKCDDRKDFWKNVSDSVGTSLRCDELRRTENIISLSYNKLPYDLRDCFLYLGMFPEGYEIPAWKLTRLWIAERFILQDQESSLEEVAEDNLNDLVARNLVMVEKTKANGDVKICRVHNMIREFCQNEVASGNKNLFQEVKKTGQGVFDPKITEIVKWRRLCIHSNAVEFIRSKPKGPGVRSLVCSSKEAIVVPKDLTSSIPDAFELLRVLDITPLNFTKFPPNLTQLIHLNYIALSVNEFNALPDDISKLWNLETIKIDTESREFVIKADISKMMQLRHLKSKAAICLKEIKDGGGCGENLLTLSRLSAKCCKEELFNKASNLKNLGIRGDLTKLADATYFEKLERLEKLKLVHDMFQATAVLKLVHMLSVTAVKALHLIPHAHSFPPKLRLLTLTSTFLDWTEMATLGGLHNLEVLKLKEMAFKGTLWEAQGGGFPQLETLHIVRTDLETWTAASGEPFPKLKNLILKNCERLQEIPPLVGKGKSLQLVEIERVSETLVQSAKKIKEEKQLAQAGEVGAIRGGFKLKLG